MARNTTANTARLFFVQGRVQGVGYRFFAERVALELGLKGYVCNLPDGRVEVYALGDDRSLENFRQQLELGPPGARVERVEERAAPLQEYKTFSIGWRT